MWLRSLLVPSRCCACGAPGADLCARCRESLERIGALSCARCGAPTAVAVSRCRDCSGRRLAFGSARAAVVYDTRTKALVHAWKERGVRRLSTVAAELVLETVPRPDVDSLAALPPDRARALSRGRHPAEQLAGLLATAWELPLDGTLARTGSAARQRGLALDQRRRNVRDAFTATATPPRSVVLVDDVYTTGATADAAARTLRRAGARRIDVVTLARVRRLA